MKFELTEEAIKNWSYRGITVAQRFFKKVSKSNGCWMWRGSCNCFGYGMARVHDTHIVAHRLSWILHKGDIPHGMSILHRCDVRNCVNPDHLFLGTYSDNLHDAISKGRWKPVFGQKVGTAKLTTKKIVQIRKLFKTLRNKAAIGRRFGVSDSAIRYIINGKWWRHVK